MPSPEGYGNARKRLKDAWDAYARTVNKVADPVIEPLVMPFARTVAFDALGFWLSWQLDGGFEGMERQGMSRSAIYRRLAVFRKATGKHPDEYEIPGVAFDLEKYVAWQAQRQAERSAGSDEAQS